MPAKSIVVIGRVQGVYFRASAKQQAMLLGVTGNIKNENDGTVSLKVEGDSKAVEDMVDWCKKGPALARVKQVEVTELEPFSSSSFDILH